MRGGLKCKNWSICFQRKLLADRFFPYLSGTVSKKGLSRVVLGWNREEDLLTGSPALIKLRNMALFSFSIKGPGSLGQPLYKEWHEMLCHLVARTKTSGSQVRAEVLVAHLLPSSLLWTVCLNLISHLVTCKLGW